MAEAAERALLGGCGIDVREMAAAAWRRLRW